MRGIIRLFAIAVLCYVGAKGFHYYFSTVDPIKERLEAVVHADVEKHGGTYVPLSQIPAMFQNAVIDTEDVRFRTDPGIDPIGMARSFVVDVQQEKYDEGGSTITQQLVRSALLNDSKTITRKLKEIVMAIAVYENVPKNTVLELYANDVYYGHGAYGIVNAAKVYFGTTPSQLTDGEATLLAGLPNAPSVYDPFRSYTLARQRQKRVLDRMVATGDLSQQQADTIYAEPLPLTHVQR